MILGATVAVVVADHSKFGRITPVKIANFDKAHYVVTDVAPDRRTRKALETTGPELILAQAA